MAGVVETMAAVDAVVRNLASEASGEWVDYDPQTIAELATLHLQLTGGERKRVKLQSADPTSASWAILVRPGRGKVTPRDVEMMGQTADDDIEWARGDPPQFRLRPPS